MSPISPFWYLQKTHLFCTLPSPPAVAQWMRAPHLNNRNTIASTDRWPPSLGQRIGHASSLLTRYVTFLDYQIHAVYKLWPAWYDKIPQNIHLSKSDVIFSTRPYHSPKMGVDKCTSWPTSVYKGIHSCITNIHSDSLVTRHNYELATWMSCWNSMYSQSPRQKHPSCCAPSIYMQVYLFQFVLFLKSRKANHNCK